MNMPPAFSHSSYDNIVKEIMPHYVAAMNNSMVVSANNVSPPVIKNPHEGLIAWIYGKHKILLIFDELSIIVL